ncbi:hypothetical protein OVS_02995 [Mycoplasma ovis str. Michigan]|uniref:Uncharacterized protein n=1 Tax=Mycoplasma ovis str. Michigan TaxID=1415773 RepID=A0ABM5P1U0_9MOLU|nr:hypothetical protein OVS_02995 [Mycoplasma ovis str. Michigan]
MDTHNVQINGIKVKNVKSQWYLLALLYCEGGVIKEKISLILPKTKMKLKTVIVVSPKYLKVWVKLLCFLSEENTLDSGKEPEELANKGVIQQIKRVESTTKNPSK